MPKKHFIYQSTWHSKRDARKHATSLKRTKLFSSVQIRKDGSSFDVYAKKKRRK